MRDYSKLISFLEENNYKIKDEQIQQFDKYYEALVETNKVMNLTSITEFDEVIDKHFIDSVAVISFTDFNNIDSFIDVGTGAGFPGIPLKILFPDIKAVLIDSLGKRIDFLHGIKESLGLEDIELIHTRSEDIAHEEEYRENFDLCVSRAVASLNVLSEYCLPFVKVGGGFIPYKSENCEEELKESENSLNILGGTVIQVKDMVIGVENATRRFPIIKKVSPSPEKYPRKAGKPSKKPL